jgi:hypothetical protein
MGFRAHQRAIHDSRDQIDLRLWTIEPMKRISDIRGRDDNGHGQNQKGANYDLTGFDRASGLPANGSFVQSAPTCKGGFETDPDDNSKCPMD